MLMVLLCIACGGVPIIENPGSTLVHHHQRFQHLVTLLRAKGIRLLAKLKNCVFFTHQS